MPITALFLDIGGVRLTNGWDHHARKLAARTFDLDLDEMEDRHHLTFDTYELGKLTLERYLSRVVFYQKRPFTPGQVRKFMIEQSQPFPQMIELVRELNAHRIRTFKLAGFVDFFVSFCFVHIRKPDEDIFRLALDIARVPARQVVYIEDTPMFAHIAEGLGVRGILHTDYTSACAKLASFGLQNDEGLIHEAS